MSLTFSNIFKTRKEVTKMNNSHVLKTVILIMVLVDSGLVEEATAHPCGRTFLSALIQLVPCRPSVAPFSTLSPNGLCCAAIKRLGQPCLCALSKGPPISGVDRALSLQLPGKCSANFPPCN
ncbi:putative lipid-transfer protein DIR1 [Brassica rapa]|nr:putative lipid-transfer protein DIR1 [Brassica rapa]